MNITTQDQRDIVVALEGLATHNHEAANAMRERWADRTFLDPEVQAGIHREVARLVQRGSDLRFLAKRIRSAKQIDITPEETP